MGALLFGPMAILLGATLFGQAAPQLILPVQSLGIGDLLSVQVYDAPEFSISVRISQDGDIRLPLLKAPVKAAGVWPRDLETAIAKALQQEQLLRNPIVTVNIQEYRSRLISVIGAVHRPISFQAAGPMTLTEAIARAEGLSPTAGEQIFVSASAADARQGGDSRRVIRVADIMTGGDPAANITLNGGEEIRVPEGGKVFLLGNVRRPGAFPANNEGGLTVMKALAMAEGLLPYFNKTAYVYRRQEGSKERKEIAIELKRMMDHKAGDVALTADDILYIPDNKGKKMTIGLLEKAVGFGASTASGVLIWR